MGTRKYAQLKDYSLWSFAEKLYFSALQAANLGTEFVILFFILSGFSIAFSLNRLPRINDFYIRRLIRIYPPYIVALTWAFAVFVIIKFTAPATLPANSKSVFDSFDSVINNIFYNCNGSFIDQFWSVRIEVIFYLLVPFYVMNKNLYFIISLIIAVIGFFISWNHSLDPLLSSYVFDYNIYFAIGIFCFHHFKTIGQKFIFRNIYQFYAVSLLLFTGMVVFKFIHFKYWEPGDFNKISFLIASLFSIILLFNFLHHKIKNWVLLSLGKMSYTIYITHLASIILLSRILLRTGIIDSIEIKNKYIWFAGIPFALVISYILYLVTEKPSKQLLNKLRKKGLSNEKI